ncbi:hypothetical protein HK405_010365, partial [Cladochytrium tenue]
AGSSSNADDEANHPVLVQQHRSLDRAKSSALPASGPSAGADLGSGFVYPDEPEAEPKKTRDDPLRRIASISGGKATPPVGNRGRGPTVSLDRPSKKKDAKTASAGPTAAAALPATASASSTAHKNLSRKPSAARKPLIDITTLAGVPKKLPTIQATTNNSSASHSQPYSGKPLLSFGPSEPVKSTPPPQPGARKPLVDFSSPLARDTTVVATSATVAEDYDAAPRTSRSLGRPGKSQAQPPQQPGDDQQEGTGARAARSLPRPGKGGHVDAAAAASLNSANPAPSSPGLPPPTPASPSSPPPPPAGLPGYLTAKGAAPTVSTHSLSRPANVGGAEERPRSPLAPGPASAAVAAVAAARDAAAAAVAASRTRFLAPPESAITGTTESTGSSELSGSSGSTESSSGAGHGTRGGGGPGGAGGDGGGDAAVVAAVPIAMAATPTATSPTAASGGLSRTPETSNEAIARALAARRKSERRRNRRARGDGADGGGRRSDDEDDDAPLASVALAALQTSLASRRPPQS